jgi:hypothetical protein
MTPTIQPTARVRAFAKLCATIEDIGGPGVDGAAIAGLYIGSKIARFDRLAYRVSEGAFLDRAAILAAQSIVARVDAEAVGRSTTPTTGPIQ